MTEPRDVAETVSLLQDLGLKEYEARSFLALTQLPTGTAKEVSEISEVPRTRVYDAVRVLEARGLVEVQHATPKQFRALGIEEATATLRQQFDDRIDTLQSSLERLDLPGESNEGDRMQEVWSQTGSEAIQARTGELVERATSELVLVVVEEAILTDEMLARLHEAADRGVTIVIGSQPGDLVADIEAELPDVEVFETELDWLDGPADEAEVAISRLLLVDRTSLLVSSYYPNDGHEEPTEQGIVATGLHNGVVVLVHRLLTTGLLAPRTPAE